MLHAPDHARNFLRIQLGLSLGQSYHLHRGAEKVPGKTFKNFIYHHQNYQNCQSTQSFTLWRRERIRYKMAFNIVSIRLQINQICFKQKKYFVWTSQPSSSLSSLSSSSSSSSHSNHHIPSQDAVRHLYHCVMDGCMGGMRQKPEGHIPSFNVSF